MQFYKHFKKFHEICFCSYFHEIWIFRESNYIFEISRPRTLKMIYNMFIILKFEFFSNSRSGAIAEPFRKNCSLNREIKIFFKYLKWILFAAKFLFQRHIVCWGKIYGSKTIGGGRGGGGGRATSTFYSVKLCTKHIKWWKQQLFHMMNDITIKASSCSGVLLPFPGLQIALIPYWLCCDCAFHNLPESAG